MYWCAVVGTLAHQEIEITLAVEGFEPMYPGVAAATSTTRPVPAEPTINGTHQDTIRKLQEAVMMADGLLVKLRGAQPEDNCKSPEEMPSVISNAGKINLLASVVCVKLNDLHRIVGEN